MQTLDDPEFRALLARQSLDLDPIQAAELTTTVRDIYSMPEAAMMKARSIINSSD
jgi:hypothetical protein